MTMKVSAVAEKALQEQMNEALDAIEPGDKDGALVSGFKEHGVPAALSVETAGYVKVWNVETGDQSVVNRNMLATQLNKRDEAGGRAFTTDPVKVKGKPVIGTLTCLLHASHSDRSIHAALGFPVCKKSNLRTLLDVRTHMQARHKREWSSLEEERTRVTEAEERLVRQALIGGAVRSAPVVEVAKTAPPAFTVKCPQCNTEFSGATAGWAKNRLRLHSKRHKAGELNATPPAAAG
jgi:hypothetical protein